MKRTRRISKRIQASLKRRRTENLERIATTLRGHDDKEAEGKQGGPLLEVEAILGVTLRRGKKRFFRVHWKGLPEEEASWEPEENLSCPKLLADFWKRQRQSDKSAPRPREKKRPRRKPVGRKTAKKQRAAKRSLLKVKQEPAEESQHLPVPENPPSVSVKQEHQSDTEDPFPLPPEILQRIFALLPALDLGTSLCLVNKSWSRLARDSLLWKNKALGMFGEDCLLASPEDWSHYVYKRTGYFGVPHGSGLSQEKYCHNPWKLMASIIIFSRTSGGDLIKAAIEGFFQKFPCPKAIYGASCAEIEHLQKIIQPCGLQPTRTKSLTRFSREYVTKDWSSPSELYGVGALGEESYYLLCKAKWDTITPKCKHLVPVWKCMKHKMKEETKDGQQ